MRSCSEGLGAWGGEGGGESKERPLMTIRPVAAKVLRQTAALLAAGPAGLSGQLCS